MSPQLIAWGDFLFKRGKARIFNFEAMKFVFVLFWVFLSASLVHLTNQPLTHEYHVLCWGMLHTSTLITHFQEGAIHVN